MNRVVEVMRGRARHHLPGFAHCDVVSGVPAGVGPGMRSKPMLNDTDAMDVQKVA
jgi:hypothetical protein